MPKMAFCLIISCSLLPNFGNREKGVCNFSSYARGRVEQTEQTEQNGTNVPNEQRGNKERNRELNLQIKNYGRQ